MSTAAKRGRANGRRRTTSSAAVAGGGMKRRANDGALGQDLANHGGPASAASVAETSTAPPRASEGKRRGAVLKNLRLLSAFPFYWIGLGAALLMATIALISSLNSSGPGIPPVTLRVPVPIENPDHQVEVGGTVILDGLLCNVGDKVILRELEAFWEQEDGSGRIIQVVPAFSAALPLDPGCVGQHGQLPLAPSVTPGHWRQVGSISFPEYGNYKLHWFSEPFEVVPPPTPETTQS